MKVTRVRWTPDTTTVEYSILSAGVSQGVHFSEAVFMNHLGALTPFDDLRPFGSYERRHTPVVVLFSDHGDMEQVALDTDSYQHGAALALARSGFLVFVMEDRDMGKLSYLGDYLRIDAEECAMAR